MRLADRIRRRYGSTFWEGEASGASILTTSFGSSNGDEGPTTVGAEAQRLYQSNGVVWAVVLARLSLFTEARFCLQTLSDKRTYGRRSLSILERPWPNGTSGELLARMEQDVSLWGNFFAWRAPDELVRLPPGEVTIISELSEYGHRRVIGYDWDPAPAWDGERGPEARFVPVDETCHWSPLPDPAAKFRGMSWLTPVLREIGADLQLTDFKSRYLTNAATPNMLVKYPVKLRPDTVDAIIERLQARYSGDRAFTSLVLDQGADATVVGNNLEQLNFAATQSAGAARICAAAGVPPVVAGLESTSGADYATAIRRFGDFTMRPLWRSACAALQKLVDGIPPEGVRLWFDVTDVAALRQSETERAQTLQVKAAAILTLAQAGYTKGSAVAAIVADDLTMLQEDPNAAAMANGGVAATPAEQQSGTPQEPQVGPRSPRPQTPASKAPMPPTFVRPSSVNAQANGG